MIDIPTHNMQRPEVLPIMGKALSPYIQSGGTHLYEPRLRRAYDMDNFTSRKIIMDGFQGPVRDALIVFKDEHT